jgi:hypothetical protein
MRRRRRVGLARMGRVPLVGRVVWGGGSAVQEVWGGEGEGGGGRVCVCGWHCASRRQRGGVHLLRGGRQWGGRAWRGGAATGSV